MGIVLGIIETWNYENNTVFPEKIYTAYQQYPFGPWEILDKPPKHYWDDVWSYTMHQLNSHLNDKWHVKKDYLKNKYPELFI